MPAARFHHGDHDHAEPAALAHGNAVQCAIGHRGVERGDRSRDGILDTPRLDTHKVEPQEDRRLFGCGIQIDVGFDSHELLDAPGRAEPLHPTLDVAADDVLEVRTRQATALLRRHLWKAQRQIDIDDTSAPAREPMQEPA